MRRLTVSSRLSEALQTRRNEQQKLADRLAFQVLHGYTGTVELVPLMVGTYRRDKAERFSEAEAEGEPLPEFPSFEEWLKEIVEAFASDVPHAFSGANVWGFCDRCHFSLGEGPHERELVL
jgi:hypothetical protein